MMKAGRDRVPMKIDVAVTSADDQVTRSVVTATVSSDEGRYLVTTPLATNLYKQALPELLLRLKAEAT